MTVRWPESSTAFKYKGLEFTLQPTEPILHVWRAKSSTEEGSISLTMLRSYPPNQPMIFRCWAIFYLANLPFIYSDVKEDPLTALDMLYQKTTEFRAKLRKGPFGD